jgi:GntR family transcriptional repressor for pyruvate dehydrogenase complex
VSEKTYAEIIKLLFSGKYSPDDQLPTENELKDIFGVSRNTIRTVLNKLSVMGIIETKRGQGSYLKKVGTQIYVNSFIPSFLLDGDDLIGLMEFRRGVEVASARLAAINATEDDIKNLESYFEKLRKGNTSKHDFADLTSSFHLMIAVSSKNELFVKLLELIRWITTSKMESFLYYKPSVEDSSFYHYMIFRCIRQHKPDEAAYLMDCHIKGLVDRVKDYIEFTKTHSIEEIQALQEEEPVSDVFNEMKR